MVGPNVALPSGASSLPAAESVAGCFWDNVCEHSAVDAFAVVTGNQATWLSWGDLGELTLDWITHLQRLSLPSGAHVASCLPNSLDWILIDVAAQTLGLVHVAIDPREAVAQRRALYEFSQARHVFDTAPEVARPVGGGHPMTIEDGRGWAKRVDCSAVAQILFTSGSAGEPKGVMLSHQNLLVNARAKLDAAPQYAEDLRLNILPFAHAYARTCELSSWIISRGRLAIAHSWEDLRRQAKCLRPTLINLVPYLAQRTAELLEADAEALGGRLRLLQVGGAALDEALWQRLQRLGLPPLQGYGLTEAAPVVCSNRAGGQRPKTVGPAVAGVSLRLDESGVLWCRGPNTMLGYWRNPTATRACMVDGWLCTGDLAEMDAQGHIRILGRASQQIVLSSGYKVCPELIESELCGMHGISHAVVFGQNRPYVVALLWPSDAAGLAGVLPPEDSMQEQWQMRIADRLNRFPRYAIPRKFAWIKQPLGSAGGQLTAKGSLRRGEIAARYRAAVDALYAPSRT